MTLNSELSKNSSSIKLKKEINLFTACCIIISNIVGSGIFVTSDDVFKDINSQGIALVIWTISGIICLIGAHCYTELGTLIPRSGGDYVYINQAYGRFMSFLYTYTLVLLIIPCLNATFGNTVAIYAIKLFYPNCDQYILQKLLSAFVIITLCAVNMVNIKFVSKLQSVFTMIKISTMLLIIFLGFYRFNSYNKDRSNQILNSWFDLSKIQINKLADAFYSGLFTYSGWHCINYLIEELKEPTKNLPRAIFLSLPLITFLYVITNIAYFFVLTPNEIIDDKPIALSLGEKIIGDYVWIISFLISFSTMGSLSGSILGSSRVYYAAARDGNLPQCLAVISLKSFTPITCILFQTSLSLMMVFLANTQELIFYGTFSEVFFIVVSVSSIIYYRHTQPNINRPIKVKICFPIIYLTINLFFIILTVIQEPAKILNLFLFLLSGIIVYLIAMILKRKPTIVNKISDEFTKLCQIIFQSVKED